MADRDEPLPLMSVAYQDNPPTVLHAVLCDHRDTQALFYQFNKYVHSKGTDKKLLEMICHAVLLEIRLHSHAEIKVLYPTVEKRVPGGAELKKRALAEHKQIEMDSKKIFDHHPKHGDKEFIALMTQQREDFINHAKEEEEEILPKLEQHERRGELIELAEQFNTAKLHAPLMPQPDIEP